MPGVESEELEGVEEVAGGFDVVSEPEEERGFSGARLTMRRVIPDDVALPDAVGVPVSRAATRGTRLKKMLCPVT